MDDVLWFLFCLSFFGLIYIYFGYGAILYLLAKISPFRHESSEAHFPSVTILFAAHNERDCLPIKISSLEKLAYPKDKLQILIASDASTDGTNEYLASLENIDFVALDNHSGKNTALNALLPQAKGEILFFTDANTVLHPQSIKAVARHFQDEKVGAVTGELTFTLDADWNPVGHGTGIYWRYENEIKRAEDRLGSVLVGCGSLLAVRHNLVAPLDPRVANDLEIPTRVGAQGYAVLYEPDCLGYEKPHTNAGEELSRTSRIVSRGVRGFFVLFPVLWQSKLRLWQFISHKVLRWFTLILGVMLLLCSGLLMPNRIATGIFILGSVLLFMALMGLLLMRVKPVPKWLRLFTILSHMLLMYIGATWGIWKAITGKTPATWSVPTSSRKPS